MILPCLRGIMRLAASRPITKALVRLVSITLRHSSVVNSTSGLRCWMPALLTRMSTASPSRSKRSKAATIAGSSVTLKAAPSAWWPAARNSATACSTRLGSTPLMISLAPALAMPSAMARPRPREEPVTSAVRPERSNRAVLISKISSDVGTAHGQIGAVEYGGQKVDAEAGAFHRIDKTVLDRGHGGDELIVPALVEGAHGFLDQRVGLAERHVDGGAEADRADAIMRREGPVIGLGHRRDLATLGEAAGPAQIRHHHMHGVPVEHVLVGKARAQRLAGADPDVGAAGIFGQRLRRVHPDRVFIPGRLVGLERARDLFCGRQVPQRMELDHDLHLVTDG